MAKQTQNIFNYTFYFQTYVTYNKVFTDHADPDVLFVGPGDGSNGESEVFSLPSFTPANCTPPVFPISYFDGYVGSLSADGPLLCGGWHSGKIQITCYLLARNSSWVISTQMKTKRLFARALETEDGWWVTGDIDNYDIL